MLGPLGRWAAGHMGQRGHPMAASIPIQAVEAEAEEGEDPTPTMTASEPSRWTGA